MDETSLYKALRKLRSQIQSTVGFFCDMPRARNHSLLTLSIQAIAKKLYDTVEQSSNAEGKLKLTGCIEVTVIRLTSAYFALGIQIYYFVYYKILLKLRSQNSPRN